MTDLIGGRIVMLADTMPAVMPYVKAGKVRADRDHLDHALAVLSGTAHARRAGLKGFDAIAWAGLFVPAGTPAPSLDRLNAEVVKAVNAPADAETLP